MMVHYSGAAFERYAKNGIRNMEIKVFTQFAHNLHICLSMCKMYSTYCHGLTVFGVNKYMGVILFEFPASWSGNDIWKTALL